MAASPAKAATRRRAGGLWPQCAAERTGRADRSEAGSLPVNPILRNVASDPIHVEERRQ